MSDHLKSFLSAWLDWVESGAPADEPFCQGTGLCDNFEFWLYEKDMTMNEVGSESDRLIYLFESEGLDKHYPFGGEEVYLRDLRDDTQHLNIARLSWVRSKVSQFAEV